MLHVFSSCCPWLGGSDAERSPLLAGATALDCRSRPPEATFAPSVSSSGAALEETGSATKQVAWVPDSASKMKTPEKTRSSRVLSRTLSRGFRAYHHMRSVPGHSRPIACVCINEAGNRVATASDDGNVSVWRVSNHGSNWTLEAQLCTDRKREIPPARPSTASWLAEKEGILGCSDGSEGSLAVTCLAWSDDGDLMIAGTSRGELLCAEICANPAARGVADGSRTDGRSARGSNISSDYFDLDVDALAGTIVPVWVRRAHARSVTDVHVGCMVDWKRRAAAIPSGSGDGQATVDAAGDGGASPKWKHSAELARSLLTDLTPDFNRRHDRSEVVVSASKDGSVRLWSLEDGAPLVIADGVFTGVLSAVQLHPYGRLLLAGGTGKCVPRDARSAGNPGAVSPDGHPVVFALPSGRKLRHLEKKHCGGVTSLAISDQGSHIISSSGNGAIYVHEVATGRFSRTLLGHSDEVTKVALRGEFVVSASWDFQLRVWHWRSGDCITSLRGTNNGIRAVAVAPDSSFIVSGGEEKDTSKRGPAGEYGAAPFVLRTWGM